MNQITNSKQRQYDLEERTLRYTQRVIKYIKKLKKTLTNTEISKQLMRSSGSVGANYIEANESLSKKDFLMRMKICKKEVKESRYWLLLSESKDNIKEREYLIGEATELMKIFGSILEKSR